MFLHYFTVDCPIGCGENSVKEKIFDNCVIPQFEKQIIEISLILDNDIPFGFGIYQIDSPQSDWCKKEGWGFIREFYIDKAYRKKGHGLSLVNSIQQALWSKGAENIYLTSDDAIEFWKAIGYTDTGDIESNGNTILVKNKTIFEKDVDVKHMIIWDQ